MVQLQADLKSFRDAGIQVVGISYDSVAILKKFGDRQKIAFPLLSDPERKTIRAFGILDPNGNGFPHPGTFVLDREGVVRAKLFLDGFRERHTTKALIEAAESVK